MILWKKYCIVHQKLAGKICINVFFILEPKLLLILLQSSPSTKRKYNPNRNIVVGFKIKIYI